MIKKANMGTVLRLIAIAGFVFIGGCTGLEKAETKIANVKATAEKLREAAVDNATTGAGVRTKRARYTGEEVIIHVSGWPAQYDQADTYTTKGSMTITQVIDDIAATRGIPLRSSEVMQVMQSGPSQGVGPVMPIAMPGAAANNNATMIALDYSGTLRGLLEAIAAKVDLSVRYNDERRAVEFFRFETRTLQLSIPSSKKTISANISLAGASGGGGGGSNNGGGSGSSGGNVSVTQDLTVDPWVGVVMGVSAIIDPQANSQAGGGKQGGGAQGGDSTILSSSSANGSVIANKDLNMLTITARPQSLERAVRYVSSINSKYSQNVMIDFTMYNLSLDDESSLGFTLNLLRSKGARIGGGLTGPSALLSGSSPGVLTLGVQDPDNPWSGSSLVVNALKQFGQVGLVRQTQIMAINGQPSPVKVGNDITYKSGQTLNVVANAGVTKSIQQSTITVGLTGYVLPQVLEDNRILLSYAFDVSALGAALTPDADGLVSPNLSRQSMQQAAFVRDGEALVLFGSDEQRDTLNSALHPAGFSKAGVSNRQLSVIVMQVHTGAKNAPN